MAVATHISAEARLRDLLAQRIAVLDGAWGTMLQGRGLTEEDFRGERFLDHPRDVKGDPDLLNLTRPDLVLEVHRAYLAAGADITTTNTFTATAIAQADYGLEDAVYDMNVAGARLARQAADEAGGRFVAGSVGPLNVALSLSPRVDDPAYRAKTFDEVYEAYAEQIRGLRDGGADFLLVETIFDTLNGKAAIAAARDTAPELPLWLSVTIVDLSGRTLSGQTLEAFWISVEHARPLVVGVNCSLGAKEMRPHVEELARLADTYTSCHPNAGLPNAFGGYDEGPETTSSLLRGFAEEGLVNLVGGLSREARTFQVELADDSLQPVVGLADRRRRERVRRRDVGAGGEVLPVHVEDDVRPRQVQQVRVARELARVVTEALAAVVGVGQPRCLEHRPPGAVEDEDPLPEHLPQSRLCVHAVPPPRRRKRAEGDVRGLFRRFSPGRQAAVKALQVPTG